MLIEEQEFYNDEELAEYVHFVFADQPYTIKLVWDHENTNLDFLAHADEQTMLKIRNAMLRPAAHTGLYYSPDCNLLKHVEIWTVVQGLFTEVEGQEAPDSSGFDSDRAEIKDTLVLEVDSIPFHHSWAAGT